MAFSSFIRVFLLFIGFLLLVFGAWDKLRPRAQYVSSYPTAGAVLPRSPELVTVQFSDALDQDSEISVASTITLTPSGETVFEDGPLSTVKGPSPENPSVLKVLMPRDKSGLYWVRWKAVTASGKATRFGALCFGVRMPVPDHITRDMPGGVRERNLRERSYRAVLLGGVFLMALGAVFPQITRPK